MKAGARATAPPPQLSSKQISYLKGLSHPLDAVVRLGKAGLTESALAEVDRALTIHELIKVRLERESPVVTDELEAALGAMSAAVVGQIGRIFILYRRHPKTPKIELPRSKKVGGP